MNFEFSAEQLQLREEARRFLEAECPPSTVRTAIEKSEAHNPALWAKVAEMGFLGVTVSEAHGGLGLGHLELCVIAEEFGRELAPVPFSPSVCLVSEMIRELGSKAQQEIWLPRLASGEAIGAFAVSERPGAIRSGAIEAILAGERLEGFKIAVRAGDSAQVAVVAARIGDRVAPCLVDLAQPGVTRMPVETFDPSIGHATLAFAGVAAEPLGDPAKGWANIRRAIDKAAVHLAFEQLGGAERALEMAREHALERIVFGRQLGSFQAIKHKLADMYALIAIARSNCYFGAWALSADAPKLAEAAATAFLSAAEAYRECAKENLQTHGGMGYTWESDCHLHYRRANLLALALGTMAEWEDQLIDALVVKRGEAA